MTTLSPNRALYQAEIYNFLRTLTIHYEPFAHYVNADLLRRGYAVSDGNKRSWKYYLNLGGEYHIADTVMEVVSLDTHETIVFSPQQLSSHPRTRAAYQPNGPYYERLVARYPSQSDLIKSILYPVPNIDEAIHSDNLTLLNWGSGYLEEWEEPGFVDEIRSFLEIIKERWYFNFLDDEPFFHLTFWASLQTYLAMLLMSGRLANLRTPYVHSQHLWDTLEAEGLSNYSDILNREKSMLLYQNIGYFRENAGKQSNLEILGDRLLKSFGIGLYGRMVLQETETGWDQYQLTPQFVPVPIPIKSDSVPPQAEIKTTAVMQSNILQKGLTPSDSAEVVETVSRKLGDTRLNRFFTKFLEIKPLAKHKPYAEILNMFLMETLIVSVTEGHYTKPINLKDPLTGTSVYLTPAELITLGNYAGLKSLGLEAESFPTKVQLFRSFLTDIGSPKKKLPYNNAYMLVSEQAESAAFLSDLHYDEHLNNPSEFSAMASRLWLRYMDHLLFDQNSILEKRHLVANHLASLCHQKREIDINLVSGYPDYQTWLGASGIDIQSAIVDQYLIQPDLKLQWSNLADAIWSALIPVTDTLELFGNFTLSNSGYDRLRQLFIQMCSYRVVFLEADRDTMDFSVGSTWSTDYGPVIADSFSDFLVFLRGQATDTCLSTRERELHSGFTQVKSNHTETQGGHHLTLVAKVQQQSTSSFGMTRNRVGLGTSRSVSTSGSSMSYRPAQFTPLEIN